jgi:hypothetical protein
VIAEARLTLGEFERVVHTEEGEGIHEKNLALAAALEIVKTFH